jgi:Peptidase family C25
MGLLVAMTCLNGYFQYPVLESLGEAMMKSEGGAVAVWASSGLTNPDGQAVTNQELIRRLFNGTGLTIGEATIRAKAAVGDSDVRRTWILFGDPMTKLK